MVDKILKKKLRKKKILKPIKGVWAKWSIPADNFLGQKWSTKIINSAKKEKKYLLMPATLLMR